MNDIVFITGNGRSGTHMVGEMIEGYEYRGEEQPQFDLSCAIAIYGKRAFLPHLVAVYQTKQRCVDKSHPNLWIADELREAFPQAKVVCVYRNKEDTVRSMLKHEGCMSWYHKEIPLPNRFFGIDSTDHTAEELCGLRWEAHERQRNSLKGERVFHFNYDDRMMEADRLADFLHTTVNKTIIR